LENSRAVHGGVERCATARYDQSSRSSEERESISPSDPLNGFGDECRLAVDHGVHVERMTHLRIRERDHGGVSAPVINLETLPPGGPEKQNNFAYS